MITKVYAYGCKPVHRDAAALALIDAQCSAAHSYYNRLVDLHNEYRQRRDALIRAVCPDYEDAHLAMDAATAEVERQVESIRLANAVARRKRASTDEAVALTAARAALKAARQRRKEVRTACYDNLELQARLSDLTTEYSGTLISEDSTRRKGGHFKEARANCGVYWGSYLAVEKAIEQALEKSVRGPIRRRRWTGDGLVAVQVQGGCSWDDVLLKRGRAASLIQFDCQQQRGKHKAPVVTFWLCSNTDESRKPVWVPVSAYFHRPLPADATIMGVALVRRGLPPHRMSDGAWHARFDWELQFTVRTCEEKTHAPHGECGLDLGWRLMEDGRLRVAYWCDHAGNHGEFCLPVSLLGRHERSDTLQATRDDNFNVAVASLRAWAAEHDAPDWLKAEIATAHLWKRKARLINVLNLWKDRVFPGGEEIYQRLLAWRAQDTHLWGWEFNNRRKAERIRKALYRQFAARLRQQYRRVYVEDCDWRKLARDKPAESNEQDRSKRYMKIAAIGSLRSLLVSDGAVKVESADTTRTCNVCGSVEDWDQASELVHTCVNGHEWDQDHNAALNLLARGREMEEIPGTARGPEDGNGSGVAAAEGGYSNRWKRRKEDRSRRIAETQQKAGDGR